MRKFEKVKRIEEDIKLPERSTRNSAGYDFYAIEDVKVKPISHATYTSMEIEFRPRTVHSDIRPTLVKTGVKAEMMHNEFLMLCNRSSNPKKGLILANGVGIVDSDYYGNPDNDGEIMFPFINIGNDTVEIRKGDKIGQGIFMRYQTTDDDMADGERTGGFGSTGE